MAKNIDLPLDQPLLKRDPKQQSPADKDGGIEPKKEKPAPIGVMINQGERNQYTELEKE
jgi:hypothetical protein